VGQINFSSVFIEFFPSSSIKMIESINAGCLFSQTTQDSEKMEKYEL